MISSIKTLAIQLMVGVAFAACSSSDDSIIEQPVNPTEPKTYTMIVQATKPTGDDAATRGLSLDGNTLNVKWNEGEKVWVLDNNLNILGSLTADASNNATTTLRGTITTSSKPVYLNLYLHNYNMVYTGQTGVLLKPASGTDNSIESNYDYARTDNISYNNYSVDETTSTLTVNTTANFVSHQAIVKFSLFEADGTTPIKPTSLTLTTKSPMLWFLDYSSGEGNADFGKTLELSGLSGTTNDIYVAISNFIGKTMTLTATTANGYTYTYTKSSNAQLFTHGKYYAVKVKMQKSAPAAEAVDLGLSSGTKWANMNVGATSESDYGLFFAWGETTGYAGSHDFGWTNYKWSAGSKDGKQFSKYVPSYEPTYWGGEGSADNKTKLDLEDDAAHANWGGSWRMPTYAEVNELLATETDANYTWTWTSVDGHNGYRITNKSTSATIFLPAAGYWDGTSLTEQGNRGLYWTSSLFDSPRGLILYFSNMTTPGSDFYPRSYGFTVRPVCP